MQSNNFTIFLLIFLPALLAAFVVIWLVGHRKPPKSAVENKDPRSYYTRLYNHLFDHIEENARQNKIVSRLGITICIIGLLIICYEVFRLNLQVQNNSTNFSLHLSIILGGIIIEFVGAFILFLYKSASQQAESYFKILERLVNVHMSSRILDELPNYKDNDDLKISAHADVAKLLIDPEKNVPTEGKRRR